MAKNKKNKRETVYAILAFIAVVALLYLLIKFSSLSQEGVDRTKCPYKVEGNLNATFAIKYIDSPYCIWCIFEEPILKKLVVEKGDSFRLERYDIRYCRDIVKKYRFSGTPSFAFSFENGTKEHSSTGYMGEEKLYSIICGATGNC